MLRPSDGLDGVKQFVLDAVLQAGPNPCPPIVVGVGLGGTFDKAALLAKKALLRETGGHNEDPFYAELEQCTRHRPAGLWRQDHRAGCTHAFHAHAHCRAAGRCQYQLPRGKT